DIIKSIEYRNQYLPTEEEFIEVLENIHRKKTSPKPLFNPNLPTWQSWQVAAAFMLTTLFGFVFYYITKKNMELPVIKEIPVSYITKSTSKGQKLTLSLPDGTLQKNNAESFIRIPEKFTAEKREIYLNGEAYFNVAKDSLRPFMIYSGNLLTTVLGTSFNIKSYPDETVQRVTVVSGKVSVKSLDNKSSEPAFLLPNSLLIYHTEKNENLIERNIDIKPELAWTEGVIIYEDEYLKKILKDLERWYGVEFIVGSGVDQTGKYTGTFDNTNLDNVLQGLSFMSKGFQYQIEGKKVWISK
ncbi:MAG: FecR domain-containing protein, partial [Bacteroidota bacterium]